ncbi:MAG: glutamate--cysteine ligase [Phycisphaerales bacterium]|nr:glutamate--cysteine ligase [Phycisphaerales bacterium]
MSDGPTVGLFEGIGIELEYMLVDRDRLDVLPIADRVLAAAAGEIVGDVEFEDISWSNELVLHVIELKTTGPARNLAGLAAAFDRHLGRVRELAAPLGGRLMSGAMHPWMDPLRQTRLWPHGYGPVYEAFNRIFDCRGHGWSNLQSLHINLPFDGDEEFGRLHAAIRLVLPLLPALAASSPIMDGKRSGIMDNRLVAYGKNCARLPRVSGLVIPEPVFDIAAYHAHILEPIYTDLRPLDAEGIVSHEWVNARGAIARFDRNTIEIRVIDMQECPSADLAVAAAVVTVLKMLVAERWGTWEEQKSWPTERLARLYTLAVNDGEAALIDDAEFLAAFGWRDALPCPAGQLWRHIIREALAGPKSDLHDYTAELETIIRHGSLARRIDRALGAEFTPETLTSVYRRICEQLDAGRMFIP